MHCSEMIFLRASSNATAVTVFVHDSIWSYTKPLAHFHQGKRTFKHTF